MASNSESAAGKMDFVSTSLSDKELLYAYLPEYIDDELEGELKERFASVIEKEKSDFLRVFKENRGDFQMAFSDLALDGEQLQKLRTFVEDDVERADHEAGYIKDVGRTEMVGNTLRAIVLVAIVFLFFATLHYYVGPKPKPTFNALDTLVYEAVVMMEEDGRLDLPTEKIDEVADYFKRYPDLAIAPSQVKKLEGWNLEGASVIDYEFTKIPVVQFVHPVLDDKLFFFQYEGHISDLPKAEQGKFADLVFQAYSDDNVNIIAWQIEEGMMGMAVGSRGVAELARLAKLSLGK